VGDKVEVRDYSHYNFVTPIMKPLNITREELLKGVLNNYARFYLKKSWEYWFEKDPFKRRYLLGCLWAFVKTTLNKRFYNLSRVKQKGIDFGFDSKRILTSEQIADLKENKAADVNFVGTISACGAPSNVTESFPVGNAILMTEEHCDIQVFLIEDDEDTRISLRQSLRDQEGIDIYSEATNAETGLVLLTSIAGADVALIDMSLPDRDTLELIQEFQKIQGESDNPNLKICLLVEPNTEEQILANLTKLNLPYCFKNAPIEQLTEAIKTAHVGCTNQDKLLLI
jgi:anaerobic magnesium-protoporphyrin IX monomethyl ester cyclase